MRVRVPDQEPLLCPLPLVAPGGDGALPVRGGHSARAGETLRREMQPGLRGGAVGGLGPVSVWPGGHSPGPEGDLTSSHGRARRVGSVSPPGGEESLSSQSPLQTSPAPGAGTEPGRQPGDALRWSLVQLLPPRTAQQTLGLPAGCGQPAGDGGAQLASSSDRPELALSSLPGRGRSEPALEPLYGREPRHRGPRRQEVLRPVQGLQGGPVVRLDPARHLGLLQPGEGQHQGEHQEGEQSQADPGVQ